MFVIKDLSAINLEEQYHQVVELARKYDQKDVFDSLDLLTVLYKSV